MAADLIEAERTYRRHLADLRAWAGSFVLICGPRVGGIFPTYADAAVAWMAMYGPVPVLIRRIERPAVQAVVADGAAGRGGAATNAGRPLGTACGWATYGRSPPTTCAA